MTDPQRRALVFLATVKFASPSQIGEAMDDGTYKRGHGLKAQGAGRLGGAMANRLRRLSWVEDASRQRGGFPAYAISPAGRAALATSAPTPTPRGDQ